MLDWVRDSYGWEAGAYRIECVAPRLFALFPAQVSAEGRPRPILATASTLTGCKYQARMLERRRLRVAARRRHALLLAGSLTLVGMLMSTPGVVSVAAAIAVSMVAAHSAGVLIGTFTGMGFGSRRDFLSW